MIALSGRPTLRAPDGERALAEGEGVASVARRGGAHQLSNESDAVVRYVVVSTKASAGLIEYPDSNKIAAMGRSFPAPGSVSCTLSTEVELASFDGEAEEEATR